VQTINSRLNVWSGQTVRIKIACVNATTQPTDPTSLKLVWGPQAGPTYTWVYGVHTGFTRTGTGLYYVTLPCTAPTGTAPGQSIQWYVRAQATGAVASVTVGVITIKMPPI